MIKQVNVVDFVQKEHKKKGQNAHVGTAQGKFVSRRTPQKRVGKLIWRVMRPRDQIEKNYIKFSEVRYSVLSICAARKCPDGMQTWGDVKTESHVFACPRYI